MATLRLSNNTKDQVLQKIADLLDAGSSNSLIRIFTAPMPASVDTPITSQLLLGTLTCAATCATVDGAHELTFGAIAQDASADNSGTAVWARHYTSDLVGVLDVDITTIGLGGTITMNTTSIVAGGPISMSSYKITA